MEDFNIYRKNRRNRRKKRSLNSTGKFLILFVILILLWAIIEWFLPNFSKVEFYEYFDEVKKDSLSIVLRDYIVPLENQPTYENGEIYIPLEFIQNFVDETIFWDNAEQKLTITTENKVIRMKTDELTYYVNNKPLKLDLPVYSMNNIAFVPAKIIEQLYPIDFEYKEESKIITADFNNEDRSISKVNKKNTILRYTPDKKSPIEQRINKDEEVFVFSGDGKYTKIRTQAGYPGYVKTSVLSTPEIITAKVEEEKEEKVELWKVEKGKINLVFDQITKVSVNNSEKKRIVHDGLDVIVPTWFSFSNKKGDIINIADKNYVDWAHKNGYQVWGLITDNFNYNISHSILTSTETREHVIKQLLAFVSLYELDGINIDFEAVPKSDGDCYLQFIREITPFMHQQGAVVSADFFVPKSWTKHYNRGAASKILDYAIVMGYDEHYAGSESSGSVASLNWSIEAIESTLNEGVEKSKLILGIPFYTRIWKEEKVNGRINLSSTAYGMQAAYDFMNEKGAKFEWLEDMGQYYAEIKENNITYKVWLEDIKSVEERVKLVDKYNIAGIGAWKRGLETENVWSLLKNHLKK